MLALDVFPGSSSPACTLSKAFEPDSPSDLLRALSASSWLSPFLFSSSTVSPSSLVRPFSLVDPFSLAAPFPSAPPFSSCFGSASPSSAARFPSARSQVLRQKGIRMPLITLTTSLDLLLYLIIALREGFLEGGLILRRPSAFGLGALRRSGAGLTLRTWRVLRGDRARVRVAAHGGACARHCRWIDNGWGCKIEGRWANVQFDTPSSTMEWFFLP